MMSVLLKIVYDANFQTHLCKIRLCYDDLDIELPKIENMDWKLSDKVM